MRFDKETYSGFRTEIARGEGQLPLSRRALQLAKENRWGIIGGSWLATMFGSWAVVSRNKYLTGPQKLVQARMYAQGATIAVLLVSGVMASSDIRDAADQGEDAWIDDPRAPGKKIRIHHRHTERYPGENQWESMVAQQELAKQARV